MMAVKPVNEMPRRGPQKKLPKYKALEIAKDIIMHQLATAYYSLENSDYDKYSDEEKNMIISFIDTLGKKLGKVIGRDYYSL